MSNKVKQLLEVSKSRVTIKALDKEVIRRVKHHQSLMSVAQVRKVRIEEAYEDLLNQAAPQI